MNKGVPVLVVVAALALLGGCGGGGSSSSSSSSSADFAAQAKKICKEDNAKFKAVGQVNTSDVRPFLVKLVPLLEQDLARLKGLSPPSNQQSTFDAWISDLERGTALTKQASTAASVDAAKKILKPSQAINKQADARVKQLGIDPECQTGGGSSSG